MKHLILLGDSIFDNAAYTLGGPAVINHVQQGTLAINHMTMADFTRQCSSPKTQSKDRKELFRRMVFNILIENTDDHEKNHAFIADGSTDCKYPALATK